MATLITEAINLTASGNSSGRIRIKIIDAGQGSSGIYPAATLEAAAKDKVFAKGLHMYMDHPSATENYDRPERSVRDLAAVLETDAKYEDGALYADAKVFPVYRELLTDPAVFESIGVSIRASAEVDDKQTIQRLVHAESVDFVTKAGRGGRVMEVLESARNAAEATSNDTRDWLRIAVKDSLDDGYAYVRDFDETNVWFSSWSEDDTERIYQQAYLLSGNSAALSGNPVEVRVETRYVTVNTPAAESAPDSPSNPAGVTTMKEAATMATTTIEEAELATLKESSGRVPALETAADTATNRATVAEAALAESNDSAAAAIVAAALAEAGITAPKTAARLSKGYPVKENGALDIEALAADVAESVAELQVANGAGNVRGVGDTTATETVVTAESARAEILAASGYTPKGAK